jgi:hypothetical protein
MAVLDAANHRLIERDQRNDRKWQLRKDEIVSKSLLRIFAPHRVGLLFGGIGGGSAAGELFGSGLGGSILCFAWGEHRVTAATWPTQMAPGLRLQRAERQMG